SLVFVLSAARRSATSTLFPYTTLFRSRPHLLSVAQLFGNLAVGDGLAVRDLSEQVPHPHLKRRGLNVQRQIEALFLARKVLENLDRKSTRLNSSHVAISYAVFCLKKKI